MVRSCSSCYILQLHCLSFCKYCRHQCFISAYFNRVYESLSRGKVCSGDFMLHKVLNLSQMFLLKPFEGIKQDGNVFGKCETLRFLWMSRLTRRKNWDIEELQCVSLSCVFSLWCRTLVRLGSRPLWPPAPSTTRSW